MCKYSENVLLYINIDDSIAKNKETNKIKWIREFKRKEKKKKVVLVGLPIV